MDEKRLDVLQHKLKNERGYLLFDECQELIAAAREAVRLREALVGSMTALDDWLNTYASDQCDATRVKEAEERIYEYGTIGYIAHIQKANRAALEGKP